MPLPTAYRRAPRLALALLATLALGGTTIPVSAANGENFVVADDDGYGIAECMKPGMECGRIMADAWCQGHGHGHAGAYGLADDATGSIKVSTAPPAPPSPSAVIIRCED